MNVDSDTAIRSFRLDVADTAIADLKSRLARAMA
jgi:hypothetical protein